MSSQVAGRRRQGRRDARREARRERHQRRPGPQGLDTVPGIMVTAPPFRPQRVLDGKRPEFL